MNFLYAFLLLLISSIVYAVYKAYQDAWLLRGIKANMLAGMDNATKNSASWPNIQPTDLPDPLTDETTIMVRLPSKLDAAVYLADPERSCNVSGAFTFPDGRSPEFYVLLYGKTWRTPPEIHSKAEARLLIKFLMEEMENLPDGMLPGSEADLKINELLNH